MREKSTPSRSTAPWRRLPRWGATDPVGASIVLGALVLFGLTWKVGVFAGEFATVANTLVAVADGHLHLERLVYAVEDGGASGPVPAEGRQYGRNYGQVVLTLPFLWALEAASLIADPALVLATAWSLTVAAFTTSLGTALGRRRTLAFAGGAVALSLWIVEVTLARPTEPRALPLLALGLGSVVAAALVALVVYRLVRCLHGRPVGAAAGAAVALASPVAVWATRPLHHSHVALLVVATVYAFHRSRAATGRQAVRFRVLAYVPAGLAAWVHPLDGAVLLAAVASVDLATGRSGGLRERTAVLAAAGLSLVPLALTAALTSGAALAPLGAFVREWSLAALADPSGLFATVARSEFARTPVVYAKLGPLDLKVQGEPLALSVLEAMPLAGSLLAAPVVVLLEWWRDDSLRPVVGDDPARVTDLLVVTYLAVLAAVSLPREPVATSVTVRSLHPAYPLGVYLATRLGFVRSAVDEGAVIVRAYAGTVVGGGVAIAVLAGLLTSGPHDLARLNAMLAFAAAAVLCYWGVVAAVLDGDHARSTAAGLAFAAGVTTLFVVLAPLVYVPAGRGVLAVTRLLARALAVW